MVEDYAYVGTDFIENPDLPHPPGGQWGNIGKKQETLKWMKCFLCFLMFYIFYVKWRDLYILMQIWEQRDLEEHLHWIGEVELALYHKAMISSGS